MTGSDGTQAWLITGCSTGIGREIARTTLEAGHRVAVTARNASAFCTYFTSKAPDDLHEILENHDFGFDLRYRKALIGKGIYHIPIPCKQGSISYSHSEDDINKTLEVTESIIKNLQ